jgi:ribosomal protein S18 acetylase RimI-like enzyme
MKENLTDHPPIEARSDLIIRFASRADLSQIAHIARVTWDDTYNQTIAAENRREFLNRAYQFDILAEAIGVPGHWFYLVEFRGEVVGFGHFLQRYHPTQTRAELVRLYVLPGYQNVGRGETILKVGFADLAKAGFEQCFVSVQASNTSASRFYERHGFVFHRKHGQFLGTQIVALVEYIRPITPADIEMAE